MLGRLGSALGDAGINIVSAAVGLETDAAAHAVLLVTTDADVPKSVLAAILDTPDFHEARAVTI
jgi:D-3-phosphoglycerate dehydrogenase